MLHKVSIIDYGMGNTWSVLSAFEYVGAKTEIVSNADEIYNAECLVLPGVGSFKKAMNIVKEKSLDEAIKIAFKKGTKILGICLGMQLLCMSSTEDGFTEGLSLVNGLVKKFDDKIYKKKLKVPHIGFNSVSTPINSKLYGTNKMEIDFYFVHSYRINKIKSQKKLGICEYGENFVASFEIDNIFGTQFHPEKSQTNGLQLIKNFMNIKC